VSAIQRGGKITQLQNLIHTQIDEFKRKGICKRFYAFLS
jgi:hypothetical protein